jgi:hypothetical protein
MPAMRTFWNEKLLLIEDGGADAKSILMTAVAKAAA